MCQSRIYDRGRNFSVVANGAASSTVSFIGTSGYTGSAWNNTRLNSLVTAGSWTAGQYTRANGATALATTADIIVVLKFTFGASDTVEAAYFTENETLDEAAFNSRKVGATHAAGIDENALTVLSVSQGRMANAVDEIRIGNSFMDVISPSSTSEYDQWAAQYPGIGLPGDDADGDGLNNETERTLATHPLLADTDGDSYSDGAEVTAGANPVVAASKPGDIDADALPDSWEIANFGDLSHDGTADSDDDLLIDALEFTMGFNPNDTDTDDDGNPDWMGIPGYLYVEQWNNIPGATINDLIASPAFHGQPNGVYLVTEAKALSNVGDDYGLRMSGRVTAPVTGNYRFWLAGDGQCELFLSTDASIYNRRTIAKVATGTNVNQWTAEPGQRSASISLVAGQEYYIEVLMKEGSGADHVAVAWDYPGQGLQIIPTTRLKSFIAEPGDADRDGLPDAWESQMGLDPADNGATDITQSAYWDSDGDGLRNFEEYLYGGDPHLVGGHKGFLEFDIWSGVAGGILREFLEGPEYARPADMRTWTGATVPPLGYNYGGRLRGTITAPESGIYTFWVAGDDQVDLWLSSGESRFDKERIAYSTANTLHQNWLRYGTQQSKPVWLEQGRNYYVEGLVKNASSGGDLSIGWLRTADAAWATADIAIPPAVWNLDGQSASVSASGGSIGGVSDAFTCRYFALQGDGELIARLEEITGGNGKAQAGLMIRESLDPGARNAMMQRQSDGRLVFQYRGETDGQTQSSPLTTNFPSQWLKITRKGNQLFGYFSPDGKTWQERGRCSIAMNQTAYAGFAVAEAVAANGVGAVWHDVSIVKQSGIGVVPSDVLSSVFPDSNDADDDGLPDSWETLKGLDATTAANGNGQFGDPDGDGLNNLEEYQLGSDPMVAAPVPGYLSLERWPVLDATINDLVRSPKMLVPSVDTGLLAGSEYINMEGSGYAQRARGLVVAPVTGNYRFWISGNRDFELWLSKNSSKFHKQRIAAVVHDANITVSPVGFREWDRYSGQMSEPLFLEAGQECYIEILHQDNQAPGYFSVAWSHTDQETGLMTERELVPASQLRSYVEDADDRDGDFLPDSWESSMGLDSLDNGLTDFSREGEYGDHDGDGLTNREEWLAGSDPTKADTDGDGISDYDEVRFYHSDPATAAASGEQLVSTVSPTSVAGLGQEWIDTGSGVLAASFREDGTWNFTVPADGFWVLRVDLKLIGDLDQLETLPIRINIDGTDLGRAEAVFRNGEPGFIRIFTPRLAPGNHTLNLYFDNYMARRSVVVTGISVLTPAGEDANGNGISDLIEALLLQQGTISDHTVVESCVSPFFIEGRTRSLDLFELRASHEGPGSTIRQKNSYWDTQIANIQLERDALIAGMTASAGSDRSAAGEIQPVNPGPGSTTWYTGLALIPNQATGYTAFFENGAFAHSGVVVWKPVNLFDKEEISIPIGSELLMGAWNSETDDSDVDFSINGVALPRIKALDAVSHRFDSSGEYVVTALHATTGTTQSLIVHVESADFQSGILLSENNSRTVNLPGVEPHLTLDADGEISTGGLAPAAAGGSAVRMGGLHPGACRTAVRMQPYGPILDIEPVTVVGVSDAERNGSNLVVPLDGDMVKVVSPLLVTHLPPGATVTISIFAAGVTFADGTTRKTFTAEDFDENGVLILEMFMPRERLGAPCHNIWIKDANGLNIYSS